MGEDPLQDYEKIRLENIKRNADFLAAIGINETRLRIQKKEPSQRTATNRSSMGKRKMETTIPLRRSRRLSSENTEQVQKVSSNDIEQWQQVLTSSTEADEASTIGVAALLQSARVNRPLNAFPIASSPLSSLQLHWTGVKKVANKRVSALAMHPTLDADIVFAADSEGTVGVWKAPPPSPPSVSATTDTQHL